MTSLVAQTVKRLSTMRETPVRSLGREDLLEKEMSLPVQRFRRPATQKDAQTQTLQNARVTLLHLIPA